MQEPRKHFLWVQLHRAECAEVTLQADKYRFGDFTFKSRLGPRVN